MIFTVHTFRTLHKKYDLGYERVTCVNKRLTKKELVEY
jgi:predicted transcriptional regulator